MPLVWMDCGDGRQPPRASPFREGKRLIEPGGFYMIDGTKDAETYEISYFPTMAKGGPVSVGTASTLGDARVEATYHYFGLREQAKARPHCEKESDDD